MSGEEYVKYADEFCTGATPYIADAEAFVKAEEVDGTFTVAATAISFQCELYSWIS